MRLFINPTQQPVFLLVNNTVVNIGAALREMYVEAKSSNVSKDTMERNLLTRYSINARVVENSWHWTTVTIDILPSSPFSKDMPETCGALTSSWITPANRQHETHKMITSVTMSPGRDMDASIFGLFGENDVVSDKVLYYHSEISKNEESYEGHFLLQGDDSTNGEQYALNQVDATFIDHPDYKRLKVYYPEAVVPKPMVATLRRLTARAYAEWNHTDGLIHISRGIDYCPETDTIHKTVKNGTGVFIGEPLQTTETGAIIGSPGVWRLAVQSDFSSRIKAAFAVTDNRDNYHYIAVINSVGYKTYTYRTDQYAKMTKLTSTQKICKWALGLFYNEYRLALTNSNDNWEEMWTVRRPVEYFPWSGEITVDGPCAKAALSSHTGVSFSVDGTKAYIYGMSPFIVKCMAEGHKGPAMKAIESELDKLANWLDRMGMDMATCQWPDPASASTPAAAPAATVTEEQIDPKAGEMPDGDDPWF